MCLWSMEGTQEVVDDEPHSREVVGNTPHRTIFAHTDHHLGYHSRFGEKPKTSARVMYEGIFERLALPPREKTRGPAH